METEDLNTLETFRQALAKIAADRGIFDKMIKAYEREDIKGFKEIMKKFEFQPPLCTIVCHTICWIERSIKCARVCSMICK